MKKLRTFLLIAAILLVVACVAGFIPHWRMESYVAALHAKGEKITFRELRASLSLNTEDSLAVLTNILQKLGQPPANSTNLGTMHFIGPGRARVAWKQSMPPWPASEGGEKKTTWGSVSNLITAETASLRELRAALKQPSPNAGFQTNYFGSWKSSILKPRMHLVRSAASWLAGGALVALHDGQQAAALANIQAIAGLADLHREEYELASQMLRMEVARLGLHLTWEALQKEGWNDEQLLALQHCWEKLDLLEALERGMEGERCFGMEARRMLRESSGRLEERLGETTTKPSESKGKRLFNHALARRLLVGTYAENDWLFYLRFMQAEVEDARALRANRKWKEIADSLRAREVQINKMFDSPMRFLHLLSLTAIPNFHGAYRTASRTETERRLAVTAIALKRYQLKRGNNAPSLEALVTEFLAAVPNDCMSGQPLCYRVNAGGTFTLYSVGDDGKDDGGNPTVTKPSANLGLWDGLDAVWPSAEYLALP